MLRQDNEQIQQNQQIVENQTLAINNKILSKEELDKVIEICKSGLPQKKEYKDDSLSKEQKELIKNHLQKLENLNIFQMIEFFNNKNLVDLGTESINHRYEQFVKNLFVSKINLSLKGKIASKEIKILLHNMPDFLFTEEIFWKFMNDYSHCADEIVPLIDKHDLWSDRIIKKVVETKKEDFFKLIPFDEKTQKNLYEYIEGSNSEVIIQGEDTRKKKQKQEEEKKARLKILKNIFTEEENQLAIQFDDIKKIHKSSDDNKIKLLKLANKIKALQKLSITLAKECEDSFFSPYNESIIPDVCISEPFVMLEVLKKPCLISSINPKHLTQNICTLGVLNNQWSLEKVPVNFQTPEFLFPIVLLRNNCWKELDQRYLGVKSKDDMLSNFPEDKASPESIECYNKLKEGNYCYEVILPIKHNYNNAYSKNHDIKLYADLSSDSCLYIPITPSFFDDVSKGLKPNIPKHVFEIIVQYFPPQTMQKINQLSKEISDKLKKINFLAKYEVETDKLLFKVCIRLKSPLNKQYNEQQENIDAKFKIEFDSNTDKPILKFDPIDDCCPGGIDNDNQMENLGYNIYLKAMHDIKDDIN